MNFGSELTTETPLLQDLKLTHTADTGIRTDSHKKMVDGNWGFQHMVP